MFRQLREHILPHVSLVIAKSYCTYTMVLRVVKTVRVVCETFAREHK